MYVVTFYYVLYTKLGKVVIVRLWNNEAAGCWNLYLVLLEKYLYI